MFFPFFIHTSVFILIVFITDIKRAYTEDPMENNEKSRINELRKMINRGAPDKSQQIPCQVLNAPMDRVKSALKDLELMNELYCTGNPNAPAVETSRADTQDESQMNPDSELTAQYNQGHNPNSERDPLGQRTINYPLHYNQPWINYPSVYPYNYADRGAFQNPNYYYAGRSPYVPLYSANPPTQPQPPSMVGANPDHAVSQGTPVDTPSATDFNDNENMNTIKKKARKYDRHCAKRKMSKRVDNPKIDDSDYISSLNDTELDNINSTEIKSN